MKGIVACLLPDSLPGVGKPHGSHTKGGSLKIGVVRVVGVWSGDLLCSLDHPRMTCLPLLGVGSLAQRICWSSSPMAVPANALTVPES